MSLLALYVLIVTCALSFEFFLAFILFTMTKKKRIIAQFFDDAKTHDLKPLIKIDLNNDKIFKHFEFNIETNYNQMLIF